MSEKSIQETFAPQLACFGCGPVNEKGLRIRSFPKGQEVVAEWQAEPHHESFTGMLSGGIIGTLLDCHSNWTAAWHLMNEAGLKRPPCTVTAEYTIKLLRPTPTDKPVRLVARVVESTDDRACGRSIDRTQQSLRDVSGHVRSCEAWTSGVSPLVISSTDLVSRYREPEMRLDPQTKVCATCNHFYVTSNPSPATTTKNPSAAFDCARGSFSAG